MICSGYWRRKSSGVVGWTASELCDTQVVILLSAVYCTQRSSTLSRRASAVLATPMLMAFV